MRRLIASGLICGSSVMLTTGCSSADGRRAAAMSQVSQTKKAFLAAFAKQEGETFTTDRLAAVVDPTADFLSFDAVSQNKTVLSGWTEYAGVWGPGMNAFKTAHVTETKNLREWIDERSATTASLVRIYGELPDGSKIDMPGHLTLTYRRQGDQWRVVHEHMSLNVKP
jgi:ketosteroid isomerase-like protein